MKCSGRHHICTPLSLWPCSCAIHRSGAPGTNPQMTVKIVTNSRRFSLKRRILFDMPVRLFSFRTFFVVYKERVVKRRKKKKKGRRREVAHGRDVLLLERGCHLVPSARPAHTHGLQIIKVARNLEESSDGYRAADRFPSSFCVSLFLGRGGGGEL